MIVRYCYTDKTGKHKAILHAPCISSAYRDILLLMDYFNRQEKDYYWNNPEANLRTLVCVYSGRRKNADISC